MKELMLLESLLGYELPVDWQEVLTSKQKEAVEGALEALKKSHANENDAFEIGGLSTVKIGEVSFTKKSSGSAEELLADKYGLPAESIMLLKASGLLSSDVSVVSHYDIRHYERDALWSKTAKANS